MPMRALIVTVVACLILGGCADPVPTRTPSPILTTPSPQVATPTPPATPTAPAAVTCVPPPNWSKQDANGSEVPLIPDLTCENGVAAAERVLPTTDAPVTGVEFRYGHYCPPGARCAATLPDRGFVVFTTANGQMLWAFVIADGTDVNATYKGAFPPG